MRFFKKNLRFSLLVVFCTLAFVFSVGFYHSAKSTVINNMWGFAYEGDNLDVAPLGTPKAGMEWLSFNCTNAGSNCGQSNYGVNINADGYLEGYAWSPHLGWAKFGGLDGWPASSAPDNTNAKLDFITGEVHGWFRFCGPAGNPATCSGPSFVTWKNGGWDGWVKLHGDTYGVTYNDVTDKFEGFAWGGNVNGSNVVGWIDFSRVSYSNLVDPLVAITADPNPIPDGGNTTISWQGINLDPNIPCDAERTPTGGTWHGSTQVSPSGTYDTGPLTAGTYTYKIKCYGPNISVPKDNPSNNGNFATIDVKVGVEVDLTASPSAVPYLGPHQTTLKWKAIPSNVTLTNCVANSSFPPSQSELPDWKASTLVPPNNQTPGSAVVNVPNNPTTYQITCDTSVPGVTTTKTISVPWLSAPKPSIELKNTKVDCTTNPPTCTTTLSWKTENITPDTCYATTLNPDTGNNWETFSNAPKVAPNKADNGSQTLIVVPKKDIDPPPNKTTYTLTCNTSKGLLSASVFLNNLSGSGGKKFYKEN